MLTVAATASRVGRSRATVRRWIREGRVRAQRVGATQLIEDADVRAIEDELYPMAELPDEWKIGDDDRRRRTGSPRCAASASGADPCSPAEAHGVRHESDTPERGGLFPSEPRTADREQRPGTSGNREIDRRADRFAPQNDESPGGPGLPEVGDTGLEPVTSALSRRRSPS